MSINLEKLSAAVDGAVSLIQSQRSEVQALKAENDELKAQVQAASDVASAQAAIDAQADALAAATAG